MQRVWAAPVTRHVRGTACFVTTSHPSHSTAPYDAPFPRHLAALNFTRFSDRAALLWAHINEGNDFAAHNLTLTYFANHDRLRCDLGQPICVHTAHKSTHRQSRFFIFINSSVRGPFVPHYVPQGWHWTRGFTDQLKGSVRGVGASLVCLPPEDPGATHNTCIVLSTTLFRHVWATHRVLGVCAGRHWPANHRGGWRLSHPHLQVLHCRCHHCRGVWHHQRTAACWVGGHEPAQHVQQGGEEE